jgi:hypothetical protein
LWRASEGLKLNFLPTYNCDNQTGYQKTYHVETQNSPPTIVMMVSLFTKHSQQQKQMSVQLFPPYGSFTSEFKCLMSPAIAWTAHQDHPLPLALAHLLALFACPPLVQFAPAFAYHCPQQTSSNIEARSGNYGHILESISTTETILHVTRTSILKQPTRAPIYPFSGL